MVPYHGRLALRIVRLAIAVACAGWYLYVTGPELNWITALLGAYFAYAIGALFEIGFDTSIRPALAIVADATNYVLWVWLAPDGWPPILAGGYLLTSAMLLNDLLRATMTAAVVLLIALLIPPGGPGLLAASMLAVAGVATGCALFKRYLDERMSITLRHNVIIRSQAQGAREAERQRIAADFHDGPLQSFISFQMRLELIKKLLSRDVEAAAEELSQLQELCKSQVTDLRGFVRSMRPADEGMSLSASLSRMTELFQRDTGIGASYAASEIPDPGATEVSLELLQIVREAFNNVHKHSGATRVLLSAARKERGLEIVMEDNGGGFPFAGSFSLEEMEMLRLGPSSIKRRVRMLEGDLTVDSRPGEGAKLAIRVPV